MTNKMRIIDAKHLIAGRIATVAAKSALLGKEIAIINCEKAVITGSKENVIAKYTRIREMGTPAKGPFLHRGPDKILKRIVRGMIPYKQHKGRLALKRIKCYKGIPKEFEGKNLETINEANVSKMPNLKYVTIETISKTLGAK